MPVFPLVLLLLALACPCSTWPFRIFNGLSARPPWPRLPNRLWLMYFVTTRNAPVLLFDAAFLPFFFCCRPGPSDQPSLQPGSLHFDGTSHQCNLAHGLGGVRQGGRNPDGRSSHRGNGPPEAFSATKDPGIPRTWVLESGFSKLESGIWRVEAGPCGKCPIVTVADFRQGGGSAAHSMGPLLWKRLQDLHPTAVSSGLSSCVAHHGVAKQASRAWLPKGLHPKGSALVIANAKL